MRHRDHATLLSDFDWNMRTLSMWCALCTVLFAAQALAATDFKEKLKNALDQTVSMIGKIHARWAIDQYPNFLKSVTMSHTSWEVLKVKYKEKIYGSLMGKKEKFVIGFMGSSVTAGHDSLFNQSLTVKTQELMSGPLGALGIELDSRNAALGNNPCMPYDFCIQTFAGADADIVHWEQMYNCFPSDNRYIAVFEQFVRQSLALTSRPIVVFTGSSTPNWHEKDCPKDRHHEVNGEEKNLLDLLKSDPIKLVSENNKFIVDQGFNQFHSLLQKYKTAGIQLWNHEYYAPYKCMGPYIPNWGEGAASWHPSVPGHEIRAAHFSYFWLLIYKDAIETIIEELAGTASTTESLTVLHAKELKHIDQEHKYVPHSPVHTMGAPFPPISDKLRCYTTFDPVADLSLKLDTLVIPSGTNKPAFTHANIDEVDHAGTIQQARQRGYKDYKVVYHGNNENDPLSLKIKIVNEGNIWMCGPAGVWGKFPNGYQQFWEVNTEFYLSPSSSNFVFDKEKAKLFKYVHRKPDDTQTICVDFTEPIKPGDYVLTVVPVSEKKIMIAYILLP